MQTRKLPYRNTRACDTPNRFRFQKFKQAVFVKRWFCNLFFGNFITATRSSTRTAWLKVGKLTKRQSKIKRSSVAIALALVCAMLLILSPAATPLAWGNAAPSPRPSQPALGDSLQLDTSALEDLFSTDAAEISREIVRLDGRRLFAIAAPAVRGDAQQSNDTDSLDVRVDLIEDRLQRIVESNFDPDELKVTSQIDSSSRQPVIYVNYRVDDTTRNEELMTVTALDAQIHGTEPANWAKELTQIIETALIRGQRERQPVFLRRQGQIAVMSATLIVVLSLIVTYFQHRLQRERRWLSDQLKADVQPLPDTPAEVDSNSNAAIALRTATLQQRMANRQKQGVNDIQRRLLQVTQFIIWGGGIFFILGLFPYTRSLSPVILGWLQAPLKILAIGIASYLLVRLGEVLVDRFFLVLQHSPTFAPESSQRVALRFSTFSRVIKSILALVLVSSAVITALSVVGVRVGPLLAGAGIIGLGISFASQSLIKDMINGFLILLEDQYGVGDVIVVGDVAGLVENMNLRITQLRNEEGRLITIPNSAITIVQNLSKEWARVDLQINVAYSADIDKALEVIDRVAQEMSNDRVWQSLILEKPLLLGVDKLDHMGATVRLWIKTQPLRQWEVAREYRRRLKLAFDKADIPIGVPQQSLVFHNALELEEEEREKLNKAIHPENIGIPGTPKP